MRKIVLLIGVIVFLLSMNIAAIAGDYSSSPDESWTKKVMADMEIGLHLMVAGQYKQGALKMLEDADPYYFPKEDVQKITEGMAKNLPARGKPYRFELVEKKLIGKSVFFVKYMVVFPADPVFFGAVFYHPKDKPILVSFDAFTKIEMK